MLQIIRDQSNMIVCVKLLFGKHILQNFINYILCYLAIIVRYPNDSNTVVYTI